MFSQKHPEAEITAVSALELIPNSSSNGGGAAGRGLGGAGGSTASLLLGGAGAGGAATGAAGGGGGGAGGAAAGEGAHGVLAVAVGLATGLVYVLMVDLPGVCLQP